MSEDPQMLGELVVARAEGIVGVPGDTAGPAVELPGTIAAIHEHVRFDRHGRFRPLSGARTLPKGWFVRVQPEQQAGAKGDPIRGDSQPVRVRASVAAVQAHLAASSRRGARRPVIERPTAEPELSTDEVIEAVYPLALVHRRQLAGGELRVVTLAEVIARQQGRYRSAGELDAAGRQLARSVVCGTCVRTPAWAGEQPAGDAIPCPEPCSVLLSFVREAAAWQKEPPAQATPGLAIPFAAFDLPGNELREAYLAHRLG